MLGSETASELRLVELVAVLGLRDTLALGHTLELRERLVSDELRCGLVRGLLSLGLLATDHVGFEEMNVIYTGKNNGTNINVTASPSCVRAPLGTALLVLA